MLLRSARLPPFGFAGDPDDRGSPQVVCNPTFATDVFSMATDVCGNKTCNCHFCYLCNAAVPNEELMNKDEDERDAINHALVWRDHPHLYVDQDLA